MVDCPDELHRHILKELVPQIPEELLVKDKEETTFGIESESHCTLLFGVEDNKETTAAIKKYFTKPITIKSLSKIDYFDNEETAAYIPVESEDLTKLHQALRKELPNKQKAGDYKPHVTIAYLKKGERLTIKDIKPFEWQVSKVKVSKPNGSTEDVYVEGMEPEQEAVAVISSVLKTPMVKNSDYVDVTQAGWVKPDGNHEVTSGEISHEDWAYDELVRLGKITEPYRRGQAYVPYLYALGYIRITTDDYNEIAISYAKGTLADNNIYGILGELSEYVDDGNRNISIEVLAVDGDNQTTLSYYQPTNKIELGRVKSKLRQASKTGMVKKSLNPEAVAAINSALSLEESPLSKELVYD